MGTPCCRGLDNIDDHFGTHPRQMAGELRILGVIADGQPDPTLARHVKHYEVSPYGHGLVGSPGEDLPVGCHELASRVVDAAI